MTDYFISADRGRGDGDEHWRRGCLHRHQTSDDADRCAEKRAADVVVRVSPSTSTVTPAPYLQSRAAHTSITVTMKLDAEAAAAVATVVRRVRPDDYLDRAAIDAWYRALDQLSPQLPPQKRP